MRILEWLNGYGQQTSCQIGTHVDTPIQQDEAAGFLWPAFLTSFDDRGLLDSMTAETQERFGVSGCRIEH